MSLYENDFSVASGTGLPGFTVTTTGSGTGFSATAGVARSNNTGTTVALAAASPTGDNQFAQVKLPTTGASTGVLINASGAVASLAAYTARHTGTDIAIQKITGGSGTAIGNIAHTRAAGQYLRLTRAGNVLTAWILTSPTDPAPTQILQVTDTGTVLTGGTTGFRNATTSTVDYDQFAGGDVADMGSITGGTTSAPSVNETIPTYNANGLPTWRGLRFDRTGKMIVAGERLHRQSFDFIGPSGAYTPPAGLTVTSGTATLGSPAGSIGYLDLETAATVGAKAGIAFAYPIATSQHAAILIECGALCYWASTNNADFRLGLTASGGIGGEALQEAAGPWVQLVSGDLELNRTRTATVMNGTDGHRRRPMGLLILPGTKELFLMKRDKVVAYRDCSSVWIDGSATASLEITAQTAAAQKIRLTSFTVSTFA